MTDLPESAKEFFRKMGSKGGKTRKRNMTAEQRTKSARKAANARHAKNKKAKTK